MATSHLKSAAITALDATPPFTASTGQGASDRLKVNDGFVTAVAADAVGSTYQFCRVPTNVIVKSVVLESEAQGAGAIDLGVYYSDSTVDGTPPSLQGLVVPTTGLNFFATDVNLAAAVPPTNETNQSGNYNISLRQQPLWQALGLTSDPGGYFDIVGTVHTTAITTGGGRIYVKVDFAQ